MNKSYVIYAHQSIGRNWRSPQMLSTSWSTEHSQTSAKFWTCSPHGSCLMIVWILMTERICAFLFQLWRRRQLHIPFCPSAKLNEKHSITSPFDITSRLLGPYMFSATSSQSLGDKMEHYFQDHSFIPLFIQVWSYRLCDLFCWQVSQLPWLQENYLKTQPAKLRNLDGPEKQLKELELMDRAASSISDGDLVDATIHRYEFISDVG